MNNDKKNTKQSVKEVLGNNLFFLKLMLKASPAYVIFLSLDAIRGQISIFFEHTVGIGYVMEAAEFHYPFKKVATVILILAAAITIGMVFTVWVADYVGEKERPKMREKIKMMLYEKAREVDLSCYDDPEFYNDQVMAISQVDAQIDRVMQFVTSFLSGVTVFISTGIYFMMRDKFSILFAAASFVLSFVFNQMYNKLNYLAKVEGLPGSRKRDYVKRIFYLPDYAKEIRLNQGVSDILFERFKKANDEVYEVEKKYVKKKFFLGYLRRYISNDMFSDVLYISYLVFMATVGGAISFSTLAILYHSFGRMKNSMRIFTDVYPYATETSLYVARIRAFLDYEPKITSEKNIIPDKKAKEVMLKDVSFSYSPKLGMQLKNVNMHIKPGEKIALVGYNGAGKTTLVKLLMRLYDVSAGAILSDGINIKDYSVGAYRDTIGTVFQDFEIFAGNITENVILDTEDKADKARVTNAIVSSGLKNRVDALPDGFKTVLTTEFDKDGVNLSGGESQKLAVSRVFYKDAGLMILDEPSSALDPIAEYQLNHAMLEATKDKTVIFISHRLSTTRLADRIIMLENGNIVEMGTHEELLKLNGKYARMWNVQAGAYIAV